MYIGLKIIVLHLHGIAYVYSYPINKYSSDLLLPSQIQSMSSGAPKLYKIINVFSVKFKLMEGET